jgi:hypothetical protein
MMQRADKRKYHFIYKITRDDGRYYIGMHSTDDLDDGYFGSGKKITRSIKKYGLEKHTKEILEFLPSRETLRNREEELVTEEMVGDPLCMNIALGGKCWSSIAIKGNQSPKRNHTAIQEKVNQTFAQRNRKRFNGNVRFRGFLPDWNGRKHSEEAKMKISSSMAGKQDGEKNSQFGTCWVTNGMPIKIKKEFLDSYLRNGYRRGRK